MNSKCCSLCKKLDLVFWDCLKELFIFYLFVSVVRKYSIVYILYCNM